MFHTNYPIVSLIATCNLADPSSFIFFWKLKSIFGTNGTRASSKISAATPSYLICSFIWDKLICSLSSTKEFRKVPILSLSVMSVVISFRSSSAACLWVWIFPNLLKISSKAFLNANNSCWLDWFTVVPPGVFGLVEAWGAVLYGFDGTLSYI